MTISDLEMHQTAKISEDSLPMGPYIKKVTTISATRIIDGLLYTTEVAIYKTGTEDIITNVSISSVFVPR